MTILPGLVYEVRRTANVKRASAKKTSTAPKKVTTNSSVTVSKADFVRARSHLSPKEIVEDAKTAGITGDDRRALPDERMNVHAWIAVALNIGLTLAAVRLAHR